MKRLTPKNQRGMVAIIVTMIILIVLSLIVVGFAQLARREQRQALDRQLSTQAQYAAESGVNLIRDKILNEGFNQEFLNCNDANTKWPTETVFNSSNSSISCLLVDQSVERLEFSSIGPEATVMPLQDKDGRNFSDLTFSWQHQTGSDNAFDCHATPGQFPPAGNWNCDTGILRVDLIPLPDSGPISRSNLVNDVFTIFMYPTNSGVNTVSYGSGLTNQGQIVQTKCSDTGSPRKCNLKITSLGRKKYYTRMTSVYKPNQVTIAGNVFVTGTSGPVTQATFIGGQAKIDVTAKAADVARRIQVHIPIASSSQQYDFPTHALDTADSICKRLIVNGPNQAVGIDNPTNDPACGITGD